MSAPARGDAAEDAAEDAGRQATDAAPPAADGWRRAARRSELLPGLPVAVTIDGSPLCLVHDGEQVTALDDRCAHQEFPLSEGDVVDGTVRCAWHGARFDLRTGACVAPPLGGATCGAVHRYDTQVIGDDVWVRLAPAD